MLPNFKKSVLLPAIIQDVKTLEILMSGYMNREAFRKTQKTGKVWFYSRSKKRLWLKGETSKNFLKVETVKLDCDQDTILILVNPAGPTCHTGKRSCFGEEMRGVGFLETLSQLISQRKKELPFQSYTTALFKAGLEQILAKVAEESEEVCRAARKETRQRLKEEAADLIYHLLVLLVQKKVSLTEVMMELETRGKNRNYLEEKLINGLD